VPARAHRCRPLAPPEDPEDGSVPAETLALRRLQADTFLDLSRLQREMERRVAAAFRECGLTKITPQQASALMILFQAREPLTARRLADSMGLTEVTVGRFVKALETASWVRREPDPTDSRALLIRPTRKAYRALPRFIAVSNEMLDAAFAGFSPADMRRVAKTTERLRRNLDDGAP
jgi:DNA-binding MarR family transcriptional regulator